MELKKRNDFANALRRQKVQVKKVSEQLLPLLAKDPDWPLVTSKVELVTNEDYFRERRAITRLTKKAVRLMFPGYKVFVWHDTGTASQWVQVDLIMSEFDRQKVKFTRELKEKELRIRDMVKRVLMKLGIRYGVYYTDYGFNDSYQPTLSVTINHCL